MKRNGIIILAIILIAAAVFLVPALGFQWPDYFNWGTLAAVFSILVCAALFIEFESAMTGSKEIALIAMLGTVSAVLRVPFAAIPSVQPCTYLIICSGYVFGPAAGLAVGAMTPLVSNFFLGHGPWTLYQMIAWGLGGVCSGYLGKIDIKCPFLIAFGIVWGYVYGAITNIWFWTSFVHPLTLQTFLVTQVNTVWFDTLHAAGNAVFIGLLGKRTIAVLHRFKDRFSITCTG